MNINVYPKERVYFCLMLAISILSYAGLFCFFIKSPLNGPMILGYLCAYLAFIWLSQLLSLGHLRGNAIEVTEQQFPAIYSILKKQCKALELKKIPTVYVVQSGGILNAFVTRLLSSNYMILYSEVVADAYQEGMSTLEFIIGHELGHIKRNHLSLLKILLIPGYLCYPLGKAYSRAREYSCDLIGQALCPEGAEKGILLLATGRGLSRHIAIPQLLAMQHQKSFAVSLAEFFSTHPMLIKRLAKLHENNQEKTIIPAQSNNQWAPLKRETESETQN